MPNKDKLKILKQIMETTQKNIESAQRLILELSGEKEQSSKSKSSALQSEATGSEEIVEGVFDGQHMVSASGKKYPVPENYASKSKLIEGDILKLTITPFGQYVYKQISPKDRLNLRGKLLQDKENGQYKVLAGGKEYKVLTASVTYYQGKAGDEVVITVPVEKQSKWAAIEDIRSQSLESKESSDIPSEQEVEELLGEIEEI